VNYKVLYKSFLFAGFGLLIILALIYFFLLLGPGLKKVAELNKKISDLQLKIEKYREFSSKFKGMDDIEKSLIEKINQIYEEKFPQKDNLEKLTNYIASLIRDFQQKAKIYQLQELSIESKNSFIQINLGYRAEKKAKGPARFNTLQPLQMNRKEELPAEDIEINLSYSAKVENGIHFVQDMLYSYPALRIKRFEMKRKKGLTSFEVIFKVKTREKEG